MKKGHDKNYIFSRASLALNLSKGFAHPEVLILILINAIVGVVVFTLGRNSNIPLISQPTPAPNEMSDWEAYTSPELKVSFQHPSGWYIDTGKTELEIVHIKAMSAIPEHSRPDNYQEPAGKMVVDITPLGDYFTSPVNPIYSTEELKEFLLARRENCTYRDIDQKKLNNGMLYTLGTTCPTFDSEQIRNYFLDSEGNVIVIQTAYEGNVDTRILDQILSTFRFSDPSEAEAKEGESIDPPLEDEFVN